MTTFKEDIMRSLLLISVWIAVAVSLSSCAEVVRSYTDAAIELAAKGTDRYLAALDTAHEEAELELQRIEGAYCLAPHRGLRRYAAKSIENAQRVGKYCNSYLNPVMIMEIPNLMDEVEIVE